MTKSEITRIRLIDLYGFNKVVYKFSTRKIDLLLKLEIEERIEIAILKAKQGLM